MNDKKRRFITSLGKYIADKPLEVAKMLKNRGIDVPADIKTKELTGKVIGRIKANDKVFVNQLSQNLLDGGYLGKYDYQDGGKAGIGVGGLIGGVANMLGSIFGKIGAGKEREAAETHDRNELMLAILNRNTEREKQAAGATRGKTTIMIIVIAGIVIILTIVLIFALRKR